ncbi:MAG: PIN domain-containing protein [Armatimonadota bacterium]|nr:PIN domain-containing protein [Armatimonadota bacterium]MDR7452018.1 PIN domain-containing protein [Armatimonadota bacterium]MDR7467909.1 PIN domain-containing protein [Armatimonadota bacterium]MDR7494238.1 PIN domain-containing protein [Armatimonadota bacterium]MDR7500019.1 PIN domain-containing protein [Armatimonadota bacterium]
MYTTDTHGLLWHLQESNGRRGRTRRRLSPRVRNIFARADEGRETILIPAIVLVELVYLAERGTVPAALVDQLLADLGRPVENYRLAPLDLSVIRALREIPALQAPEMPDRIIAATARATSSRLLSRDESLRRIAGLEVVW